MVLDTYTGYDIKELNNELIKFTKELDKKNNKYQKVSDNFNNICLKNIIKLKTILNKKSPNDFNFEIRMTYDNIYLYYENVDFAYFTFSYDYIYNDAVKKEFDIKFIVNYLKYDFNNGDNKQLNNIILVGNISEDIKNKSILYKNLIKFYKEYYDIYKEKLQLESEISEIKNNIKSINKSVEFENLKKCLEIGVSYVRGVQMRNNNKREKIHKFTIKKIVNNNIYIEYCLYDNIPEDSLMRMSKDELISYIYDKKFKLESIKDERLLKIKNLIY